MRCVFFVLIACCLCLANMDLFVLENAYEEGLLCLDGSPGIYYFKAGSKENSTKWVLHLLGGGLCFNEGECFDRSNMFLGSSRLWPPQMAYGGPIDENATYNPDFYDWNHAFFVYCDGACFSGDRDEPILVNEKLVYFRGHRILTATLRDLLKNHGLDKATDVLVVGDSAGGMATFFHIDEIKSYMPKTVKRFKASPFSGVFLDVPNAENISVWAGNMQNVFNLQNCSGGLNPKCMEAQSADEGYKCMFAEYTMLYTDTLLMPVGSAYDSVGTRCVVGGEPSLGPVSGGCGNCSAVPGWKPCEDDPSQCTEDQWKLIEAYGNRFVDVIEKSPKLQQDGNGIFECNCHTHSMEGSNAWYIYTTNGVTMREAVRDWYFSDNEPYSKHLHKDCLNHDSYDCNPSCSVPL